VEGLAACVEGNAIKRCRMESSKSSEDSEKRLEEDEDDVIIVGVKDSITM
jgi:hypothetical protein